MSSGNAVVDAILAATQNGQLRAALLMGSKLESGWRTGAVGDNGTSFGPFQIHLPAHPGVTASEAEDPSWAVNYMLPAYEAGVAKVPASLWSGDPAKAAATAAYYAERPAKMYGGYEGLWSAVNGALNGQAVTGGSGSGTGGGGTATQAASTGSGLLGPLESDVSVALNNMYMGGLMVFGLVLMVVGFFLLFKDSLSVPKIPNINVNVGGKGGSDSSSRRDGGSDAADSKPSADSPPAASGGRSADNGRSSSGSGRLNTGRAVAGTAVGRSVAVTAGRPKPRKAVMLPQRKAISS